MAAREIPSPETLRQLLRYEPETGKLFWLRRDKEAGSLSGSGYKQITIQRYHSLVHRVAWAMHHGEWPKYQIDHINGDPLDNRIANLRDVSQSENMRNRKRNFDQASGVMGVRWWANRWQVVCNHQYIGRFKDFDSAVAARKAAEQALGFHPNHGRE